MNDNYYRVLEIIENSTDNINIDTEQVSQLMTKMTKFEKREIVLYCEMKLKKIRKQLFFRDLKYGMLGGLLASILYIPLSYFFPEIIGDNLFQLLLILPCVYLVFCLRPKNPTLVKQESKYKQFKAQFSSN